MSLYDRLLVETAPARAEFLAIPLLRRAVEGTVSRCLYLKFLEQAYHHVRHTCPLLSLAAARTKDAEYRDALYAYLQEERGHDEWILADIVALGGDATGVERGRSGMPCRAMVGYFYYAIEWISPYALLGMVHVLEGMSVELAGRAAAAIGRSIGAGADRGFSYLASHASLDVAHTAFFREVLDGIEDKSAAAVIIDAATTMYWLYGNVFRELDNLALASSDDERR